MAISPGYAALTGDTKSAIDTVKTPLGEEFRRLSGIDNGGESRESALLASLR